MRKCLKPSILVQFLSAKVLADKQLFVHPNLNYLPFKIALFVTGRIYFRWIFDGIDYEEEMDNLINKMTPGVNKKRKKVKTVC